MISRRTFLSTATAGATGLAINASARSYAQILGANNRLAFAIIGTNSRAKAHLASLKANEKSSRVTHVCDVDTNILNNFAASSLKQLGYSPAADEDFRKALAAKDVDAVTIATPDHWHAPMAILALQAGKHVYLEKPCSYNPTEGEMLVAAQRQYGKLVQMGSQQRSSPHTIEIVGRIHEGLIGRAYFAKAWYANHRKTIGVGTEIPVPSTLDWDLWQGPAPRRPYKSNIHPYNWHWFKHWGTGESLNNGTHEVDVARWALDVAFPHTVDADAGRYADHDDWQFYDTMVTNFTYPDKAITWEGRSCNPMKLYDRDRGVIVYGTKGSVIIDRDGYEIFDENGKRTKDFKASAERTSSTDTIGADSMTDAHFANFIAGVQRGEKLRQPIDSGNVAVTMLQLSNIAWETSRVLHLDPINGHIQNDPQALALTKREYEKGWAPKL